MLFRMLYDDQLAQAAYLVGCQRSGEAIVIDPQRDVDRYLDAAREHKVRITAVGETHIHADYLSGVRELADRTGATVYVSDEGDADWKYEWLTRAADASRGPGYQHRLLRDGDSFNVGGVHIRALHTPGHTPEHICFLITDTGGGAREPMGIITGDFVFVGDLGRPDLLETAAGYAGVKEQSARALHRSARRFTQLPDYLQVWPAHGAGSACGKSLGAVPQSTVGYEKRFNPSLALVNDEDAFVRSILEGQPEPPLYFGRMKRLNKEGPPRLGDLPRPKELDAAAISKIQASRDIVVLDTRPWAQFKVGHLAGALHAPWGGQFPTIAGSYVDPAHEIVVVAEAANVQAAVRSLVRVGLDNVTGYITPERLEAEAAHGRSLASSPEIDTAAFRKRIRDENALVLDVRRATEHEAGHVPGSLNIAHTRLAAHLEELPADRPILVHCQAGSRSAIATAMLQRHGFDATNVAGGFGAYEKSGGEVIRETVHA